MTFFPISNDLVHMILGLLAGGPYVPSQHVARQ